MNVIKHRNGINNVYIYDCFAVCGHEEYTIFAIEATKKMC